MWLEESKRRIFLDMHFPDWPHRQTATNFNPEEIAETFAKAKVDSVILYAKCQFGNFYYDTKIGHKHSGLGQLDLFADTCRLLKEKGIAVIAYYSVAWDELFAAEHPDWQVQQADGTVGTDEFRWSTLCVNSPYREVVKQHLEEISCQLKPDGFWIDMTIIGQDCCYCPHCKAKYREIYHSELEKAPEGSEQNNRFAQFRYNYIEEFYKEIYALIRSKLPTAKISNNYWGYPYSFNSMGSRAIGALKEDDYITGEAYTDWTGLSAPGFFSKWLRSAADGRPYEALIGRFVGTWDYSTKPPVQLGLEAYTIASNGGCITIDDEPFADGSLDLELYDNIGQIFSEVERRSEVLGGEALVQGAIYHSQKSKDYYFLGSTDFISSIAGSYRMMKETQNPAEFLFDENITLSKMKKYPFILLPQVAVMDDAEVEMFKQYMEDGGVIIATGATGCYQLDGCKTIGSKTWETAVGVPFTGKDDKYSLSYFELSPGTPYSEDIPGRPIIMRSPYFRFEAPAQDTLGYVIEPICETTKTTFFHNNLPAPYEKTTHPALIHKKIGKGSLYVFAQDIFSQFATYHQLEIKGIFNNILHKENLAPDIRYYVSGNVETAAWKKDNQIILHMVNFNPGMTLCTGVMDTFSARYPRTFEFVEQVNPIDNLRIELDGVSAASAKEWEFGKTLEIEETETGISIMVPRLEQWQTIVIQLK